MTKYTHEVPLKRLVNGRHLIDCPHDQKEIREVTDSGGRTHYQRQCLTCGEKVGTFIKRETLGDLARIPKVDPGLEQYADEVRRAADAEHSEDGRRWYNEYLNSPEWKKKRQLVFRRANGLCEGCGINPPSQVHHLTYEHAGDEFLWELVAICDPCHERAHEAREE